MRRSKRVQLSSSQLGRSGPKQSTVFNLTSLKFCSKLTDFR